MSTGVIAEYFFFFRRAEVLNSAQGNDKTEGNINREISNLRRAWVFAVDGSCSYGTTEYLVVSLNANLVASPGGDEIFRETILRHC